MQSGVGLDDIFVGIFLYRLGAAGLWVYRRFMVRRHISLVGMMGCGKSTVARELGFFLSRPVVDVDDLISARAGMSIPEIFEREGEAGFRQRELACVEELVIEPHTLVIATGGGAFVQPVTRRLLLSGSVVVYLRAEMATLAARVGTAQGRPLLAGGEDLSAKIARLLEERSFFYEMADVTVSVDRVSSSVVAEKLAEFFLEWIRK